MSSCSAMPGDHRRLQFCFICSLLTAVAVHAGSKCTSRGDCNFLTAPGLWDFEGDTVRWQTIDGCCHLEDLVSVALRFPEEPATRDPRFGIFLLGDSVEGYTLRAMCNSEHVQLSYHNHTLEGFWACKRGPFLMGLQTMAGVHPDGPWLANVSGSPEQRLEHVIASISTALLFIMCALLQSVLACGKLIWAVHL